MRRLISENEFVDEQEINREDVCIQVRPEDVKHFAAQWAEMMRLHYGAEEFEAPLLKENYVED